MNFAESVQYAADLMKIKNIVLGLDSMRELLRRLGDPQDSLKFIHMAGTNGKGSILAYVASVLKAAGYTVGRYNSPSVFTYCEKFTVNDEAISEEKVAELMTHIRRVSDEMEAEGLPHPTSFETETALAFLYYKEMGCDLVALECGLGGETDATNVVKTTILSMIASISLDHMQFLGNTVEEIAKAKSGIIKPGIPCVMIGQSASVEAVIRGKCAETGSELRISQPDKIKVLRADISGAVIDYKDHKGVEIPLAGGCQMENAAVTLEAVEMLRDLGYVVPEEAVLAGMKATVWPGRFQKINEKPLFFIDGAHNPGAAEKLRESVKMYFTNRRILYIIGMLADKDYRRVMDIMTPMASEIYTVTPDNSRALQADKLAECILEEKHVTGFGGTVKPEPDLASAIRDALASAGEEDVILAFGSLSYLAALSGGLKEILHG